MLNMLKKVAMMTVSAKWEDAFLKRCLDHSGRYKNSRILKHQIEKKHPCPQYEYFKVISSGFHNIHIYGMLLPSKSKSFTKSQRI